MVGSAMTDTGAAATLPPSSGRPVEVLSLRAARRYLDTLLPCAHAAAAQPALAIELQASDDGNAAVATLSGSAESLRLPWDGAAAFVAARAPGGAWAGGGCPSARMISRNTSAPQRA